MANELKNRPEHSAEYFGDTREYWWNDDFIEMVAQHWRLEGTRAVLDVGCGVGHWGRVLSRVLPPDARLGGVDREQAWVDEAEKRAAVAKLSGRFSYRVASAERLPFDDATFDLATCQTLLIHVRDPDAVLAEMVRVTRPGPPYESPFERAQKEEILDAAGRGIGAWDEATTLRYFLAGGGDESTFRRHWNASVAHLQRCASAIGNETYTCAGGSLLYLAWGWRDEN